MEYLSMNQRPVPSSMPPEKKTVSRLNDYAEITIGGVVYRVSSVFASKGQMGDLLDLAVMENISRIA